MTAVFKNLAWPLASLGGAENFKFEREDWTLFRTVEGLQQKAGVPTHAVAAAGAQGAGRQCARHRRRGRGRTSSDGHGYFVEDNGPGIDGTPEDIARLFSIARPMVSTKLLRLPTRGALGNGLRVVAGAVLASAARSSSSPAIGGSCCAPSATARRRVVQREAKVEFPIGTRIEISFGPALPSDDPHALSWAQAGHAVWRSGTTYGGQILAVVVRRRRSFTSCSTPAATGRCAS